MEWSEEEREGRRGARGTGGKKEVILVVSLFLLSQKAGTVERRGGGVSHEIFISKKRRGDRAWVREGASNSVSLIRIFSTLSLPLCRKGSRRERGGHFSRHREKYAKRERRGKDFHCLAISLFRCKNGVVSPPSLLLSPLPQILWI